MQFYRRRLRRQSIRPGQTELRRIAAYVCLLPLPGPVLIEGFISIYTMAVGQPGSYAMLPMRLYRKYSPHRRGRDIAADGRPCYPEAPNCIELPTQERSRTTPAQLIATAAMLSPREAGTGITRRLYYDIGRSPRPLMLGPEEQHAIDF